MNINSQKKEWSCVLNYPKDIESKDNWFEFVINRLNQFADFYSITFFLINHDKDIHDDGTIKTEHLHLVLITNDRIRGSTLINRLSDCLILKKECISVQPVFDLAKRVQYLTHKNDINKYQYSVDEVITNNREVFESIYCENLKTLITTQQLINICDSCSNAREIMFAIGIENYQKYYRVIQDLYYKK